MGRKYSNFFLLQAHYKKVYGAVEERLRHNIYFANKEKKAKYDELHRFGLPIDKIELDVYADFTLEELKAPEESEMEWDNYKVSRFKHFIEKTCSDIRGMELL